MSSLAIGFKKINWKTVGIGALVIAALLGVCLFLAKWIWYGTGDWLSVLTAIIIGVGWFVCFMIALSDHETVAGRMSLLLVPVTFAVSIFCLNVFSAPVPPPVWNPAVTFWVNPTTGENTLSQRFIFVRPFSPMSYIELSRKSPRTAVRITSRDSIPLLCSAKVSGLIVDANDTDKLAKFASDVAATKISLNSYIDSKLDQAIAAAMSERLGAMTTEEIERLRNFVIPYQVGTPLGDVLASVFYKWNNGEVTVSCRTVFN